MTAEMQHFQFHIRIHNREVAKGRSGIGARDIVIIQVMAEPGG
jgi:hypothetical protein